uniref:Uncharacterized protein n=1 Tax=Rhodopseudomonas palustris (strain BisA53) TaxID=316055 RepID=Q07LU1_RHOP5
MIASPSEPTKFIDKQTAQRQIDHVLMTTFCRALNDTRLPPVVVLQMIASALGKTYANAAAAHQAGRCGCGWHPSPLSDVDSLRSAVAYPIVASDDLASDDLASMGPAGHA